MVAQPAASEPSESEWKCETCGAPAQYYLTPKKGHRCRCGAAWEPWPFAQCNLQCPEGIWEMDPPRTLPDGRQVTSLGVEEECNGCGGKMVFDVECFVEIREVSKRERVKK